MAPPSPRKTRAPAANPSSAHQRAVTTTTSTITNNRLSALSPIHKPQFGGRASPPIPASPNPAVGSRNPSDHVLERSQTKSAPAPRQLAKTSSTKANQ